MLKLMYICSLINKASMDSVADCSAGEGRIRFLLGLKISMIISESNSQFPEAC